MKISVIIPVYNVEKYLEECLKSVTKQTYENLEIILIDDGSTDNSPKICDMWDKLDDRIIVIHKENGGLSEARNSGLDIMTGECVFFLDSDDILYKDTLKILLDEMRSSRAEIVSGNLKQFKKNSEIKQLDKNVQFQRGTNELFYLQVISNHACGKLYKSYLFDNIRYPINRYYEDIATTHLLYKKSSIISHTNEGLYLYRIHENTITSHINRKNLIDLNWVYENMKNIYPKEEKYEYYLLTILYTIFSAYIRADKKIKNNIKLDKYVRDEFRKIRKNVELKKFRKKSPMYNKIILYNLHVSYILMIGYDFMKKILRLFDK